MDAHGPRYLQRLQAGTPNRLLLLPVASGEMMGFPPHHTGALHLQCFSGCQPRLKMLGKRCKRAEHETFPGEFRSRQKETVGPKHQVYVDADSNSSKFWSQGLKSGNSSVLCLWDSAVLLLRSTKKHNGDISEAEQER